MKTVLIIIALVLIVPFTPEITAASKPVIKQYKSWVKEHINQIHIEV